MFVDGLLCTSHPYDFMARQGCHELLEEARGSPERVLPCLPKIIPLVRVALTTKHPLIVIAGLQFLRELANCDPVVRTTKCRIDTTVERISHQHLFLFL
jgi:hypothetical protein